MRHFTAPPWTWIEKTHYFFTFSIFHSILCYLKVIFWWFGRFIGEKCWLIPKYLIMTPKIPWTHTDPQKWHFPKEDRRGLFICVSGHSWDTKNEKISKYLFFSGLTYFLTFSASTRIGDLFPCPSYVKHQGFKPPL